ncbi:hypothetical protein BJ878DRAFT_541623 [Calycina marina]|uniref:Nuclear membrane fusion protein Kar5 n=1 Tax=Calycina marina TaxID=1763456 RepID=A0A9P8CFW2_9HELO|nr:hypothetical protein BJ878DRAFT_541623 [Calycina marina]
MKLQRYYIFMLSPPLPVSSFNLFNGASEAHPSAHASLDVNSKFNAQVLLDSRVRKPEIYTKAMLELKRLEEEPICHRVAVQLLMNNCQGLENVGESDYEYNSAHLQRHHVESFAASLAICDLERGGFAIPTPCLPFTSSSLIQASRDQKGNLQVSPDQVGSCLGGLAKDPSQWNTWLSYRDKALLFCRAARFDVDKDQAILHHKKLAQIMKVFADELDEDLDTIKAKMANHAHAADSYFDGVVNHAENLKKQIQGSMEILSKDFTEAASSIKTSIGSTLDLQRLLRNLVETVMASNADLAASQEQALSATTNRAKAEMEDLNALAGDTGATIAELKEAIATIRSIGERQDSVDKRSEALYRAMENMTTLLNNHTENLESASSTAYNIHNILEKASSGAALWKHPTSISGTIFDYGLRIAFPAECVLLGNYGLHPSLLSNVALALGGYGFAETVVQFRRSHFSSVSWEWLWAPSPIATMRRYPINSYDDPGVDFSIIAPKTSLTADILGVDL